MKNLFIIILILPFYNCFAQRISHDKFEVTKPGKTLVIAHYNHTEIKTKDLIISALEIEPKGFQVITKDQIKKYTNDTSVIAVMVYKLNDNVKLITLQQLLDNFNIDEKYRSYSVLADDQEVTDKNKMLISKAMVDEIVLYPDQQYLNIHTKYYQNGVRYRKDQEQQRAKNIEFYKKSHPNKF